MNGKEIYDFIYPHLTNKNIGELINTLVNDCLEMRDGFEFGAKHNLESEKILYDNYNNIIENLKEQIGEVK